MAQRELLFRGETPTWVTFKDVESTIPAGDEYWFLRKFEYIPFPPSVKEHAYIMEPRGAQFSIHATNNDGQQFDIPLDKPIDEPAGNVPLLRNVWTIRINGLPSDEVSGLKLPSNLHVTYNLWFEKRRSESDVTIEERLRNEANGKRALFLNPDAGLQKEILKAGFMPTSTEFSVSAQGQTYVAQVADSLEDNVRSRVYFAKLPFQGNVRFIEI
jgi:hypothetical protein